jgi:DNA-binding transcriptional regulator YiaG
MTPSQIRTTRKRLGLSCSDFAAALGFTCKSKHITVWRWETGNRAPSAQTIALLKLLSKSSMSPVLPKQE